MISFQRYCKAKNIVVKYFCDGRIFGKKILKKIIIVFAFVWFFLTALTACDGKSYLESAVESESFDADETGEDVTDSTGYIQISGAVANPGVYEISVDTRLFEVIEMAGGFSEDAAEYSINQVQKVSDGDNIHIPSILEEQERLSDQSQQASQTGDSSDKININTADVTLLMTLPGIGEAKANLIIDYRETNGAFLSIEDIMKIQGIKEGVYNKIKESITV